MWERKKKLERTYPLQKLWWFRSFTSRSTRELPVDVVSKIFQEMVKVAQKPENAA